MNSSYTRFDHNSIIKDKTLQDNGIGGWNYLSADFVAAAILRAYYGRFTGAAGACQFFTFGF